MRTLYVRKLNKIRIDKKITITEIAKNLGCSYTHVWQVFSGDKRNTTTIEKASVYIDSINKHFRNLTSKEFNYKSLKRLGFSRWEIERIL